MKITGTVELAVVAARIEISPLIAAMTPTLFSGHATVIPPRKAMNLRRLMSAIVGRNLVARMMRLVN
jgi:hypothetical protein